MTPKTAPKAGPSPSWAIASPLCLVDVVIFTIRDGKLHVLLVRRPSGADDPFPSAWALPGGFIDVERDVSIEDTARRKLMEKTGVQRAYLEQLGSFGGRRRDPRGWSVTTVYFALMPSEGVILTTGGNAEEAAWFPIGRKASDVPLAFDHGRILEAALTRLRNKVEYTSLPVHLLGPEFTLHDLQRIFEIVLGREVDKSAFRTRVLSAGFLEPSGDVRIGRNRPAQLYRRIAGKEAVFFPRTFYPKSGGKAPDGTR